MPDEIQLLRRYAENRDEKAFAALVEQTLPLVYPAALRQLDGAAHRAQDVTQTVFVELARQAQRLASRTEIIGWLYTSTHHVAAKVKRSEARRQRREEEAHIMLENTSVDSAHADWNRLRPVLDDAMHELSESSRQAILLRYFQNQPFGEIGRQLGLNEDAARMRVERALDKLHTLLARRGVTSTASALVVALTSQSAATVPAGLAASISYAALTAAPSTVGAWSMLQFMSTTKFAIGAAGMAALLLVGAAGYRLNASHGAATSADWARRQRTELAARIKSAESLARETGQNVVQLKQALADAEVTAAQDAQPKPPPWDPVAAGKQLLQRHPQVSRALDQWNDASFEFRYTAFLKARGLSDAQIQELKFLQRSFWSCSVGVDKTRFISVTPESTLPRADAAARYDALLGPDQLQAVREWERTEGARFYAHYLATGLCFTDTPLQPQQAEQMVAAISSARVTIPPAGLINAQRGENVDWDTVDLRARQILSADQLAAWQNVLSLGRARRESFLASTAVRQAKTSK